MAGSLKAETYMFVLLMPMPQKIEKASTKFSSFLVNGKLLNLLTNCGYKKKRHISLAEKGS